MLGNSKVKEILKVEMSKDRFCIGTFFGEWSQLFSEIKPTLLTC